MTILNLSRIGAKTGLPERLQASSTVTETVVEKRFRQGRSEGGR